MKEINELVCTQSEPSVCVCEGGEVTGSTRVICRVCEMVSLFFDLLPVNLEDPRLAAHLP